MNPRLQRVVVDLLEDFPVDQVVDEAVGQVRAEVPAFRTLDPEQMRADVAGAMSLAVESVRPARTGTAWRATRCGRSGPCAPRRASTSTRCSPASGSSPASPIDTMLEIARERGVDSMASLELTRAVWVHCDDAAAALAAGHRAWTESPDRHAVSSAQAAAAPAGPRGPHRRADGPRPATSSGSRSAGSYGVVLAGSEDRPLPPAFAGRLLASYDDTRSSGSVGVATSLAREPWGCPVGYGDRVPLHDLRTSFHGALLAWEMADAFGLDEPQHPDDVRLLRAVHDLPEVGDAFVEQCFGHLDEVRLEGAPRDAARLVRGAGQHRRGRRDACSCTATRCATGCAPSPSRRG